MNGPEHYLKAESLIQDAEDTTEGSTEERYLLTRAQVHATLALAAATAMGAHPSDQHGTCLPLTDAQAWDDVAGVPFGRRC